MSSDQNSREDDAKNRARRELKKERMRFKRQNPDFRQAERTCQNSQKRRRLIATLTEQNPVPSTLSDENSGASSSLSIQVRNAKNKRDDPVFAQDEHFRNIAARREAPHSPLTQQIQPSAVQRELPFGLRADQEAEARSQILPQIHQDQEMGTGKPPQQTDQETDTGERPAETDQGTGTGDPPAQRHNAVYRDGEQAAAIEAFAVQREDPADTEVQRHQPVHRQDAVYQDGEQAAAMEAFAVRRDDPADMEVQRDQPPQPHDTVYQDGEQAAATAMGATAVQREDPADTEVQRHQPVQRQDAVYQDGEQAAAMEASAVRRDDPADMEVQRRMVTEARPALREDPEERGGGAIPRSRRPRDPAAQEQLQHQRQALQRADWEAYVRRFEKAIQEGPTHICSCCGRLWFKSSMKILSKPALLQSDVHLTVIETVFQVNVNDGQGEFCSTCVSAIKRGKIPQLCLSNGLRLPEVSPALQVLTRLEERLVSPLHVFQTVWPVMGPLGQFRGGVKGGVVNVPASVDTSVSSLPRNVNDSNIVHLRLARQMIYSRDYASGNVRPNVVYDAAKELVERPLFQKHGITLSLDWEVPSNENDGILEEVNNEDRNENRTEDEDDLPANPGGGETLIMAEEGVRIAPAAGNRPISILLQEDVEYLSFPKIFGGEAMNPMYEDKPISFLNFSKSVITSYDRRAVERNDFLLYVAKKLQLLSLTGNITTHLRKRTYDGRSITTADVLNNTFVDTLVHKDYGYKALRGIRNSIAHLHDERMKISAMIRTFALPTLFVTLTAAETQWPELLQQLKSVLQSQDITSEEASNLNYNEKAELIQKDPVTCARHFDKRFRECKKTWACTNGPFGDHEVKHHYHRIEFQHRGSPHAHMLLWLNNAPVYDPADENTEIPVCEFIDSIVSCSKNLPDETVRGVLKFQNHEHTRTCKPRPGRVCRFGIPFFPMDRTRILTSLPEDSYSGDTQKQLKETFKVIRLRVEAIPNDETETRTFEEFLADVGVSLDDYVLAVRSSLTKPKIFLRRQPCDVYTNPYSVKILSVMRSNMDIQFVLDPYACATYIVDYINKSDRGMTEMLEKVLHELRRGNESVREGMRKIANTFYNNSEMSIQEAAYNILSLPMSGSSEKAVFIPTDLPEKRVRMLKSPKQLSVQDPDSESIFVEGLLDHYTRRPRELENLCLADFAAQCEFGKTRAMRRQPPEDDGENSDEEETGYQEEQRQQQPQRTEHPSVMPLLNNSGYITRRRKPKVIRFHKYFIEDDEYNYFRSLLILYFPWRDEETDLLNVDVKSKVAAENEVIIANRARYNRIDDETLRQAIQDAENRPPHDNEHVERVSVPHFAFDDFFLNDPETDADVFQDIGEYQQRAYADTFLSPGKLPDQKYDELIEKLNHQQREYIMHLSAHFRREQSPVYHLITGGAGTGKSLLISAIFQTLLRIFNSTVDADPDKVSILLCAPTGKAAFNIQGRTIHSAFHLNKDMRGVNELSASVSNTMLVAFSRLRLVIIDEISMVSELQLRVIDARLRHIFDANKPYGGISVITVGDFEQLPTVYGSPVYSMRAVNPYVEMFGKSIWDIFQVHRLTQVMRQDNLPFQTALNHLAKGSLTPDDLSLFGSRTFTSVPADLSPDCVHLFPTNNAVDNHNNYALARMIGEEATSEASDVAVGDVTHHSKQRAVNNVLRLKPKDTMSLHTNLKLKVGARYMLVLNIDTSDGLVNGASGRLKKIDLGRSHTNPTLTKPLRVWIEFEDDFVGVNERKKQQSLMRRLSYPATWTPIEPTTVSIVRRGFPNVMRKQFPLVVAEAMTIHKSQGSTYQTVAVHLVGRITRELLYVACSRSTSPEGLYIVGTFNAPKPPPSDSPYHREIQRQDANQLVPSFRFLAQRTTSTQVIYHNIQSFQKHHKLIEVDPVFTNTDILLLGETWTLQEDDIAIPGFTVVSRIDNTSERRPHGVCVPVQSQHLPKIKDQATFQIGESNDCVTAASIQLDNTLVVSVYAKPQSSITSIKLLMQVLRNHPAQRKLVLGDFNRNVARPITRRKLESIAASSDFLMHVPACFTTKASTTLDFIFSNFPVDFGVYISTVSFYEPIWTTYQ